MPLTAAKLTVCFLASIVLTTLLMRKWIPTLDPTGGEEQPVPKDRTGPDNQPLTPTTKSTGFWIGFFETMMVFAFVWAGDFGALAIIIGAKQFVRKEEIQKNPKYYLLGTLMNVSIALVLAQVAKAWAGI